MLSGSLEYENKKQLLQARSQGQIIKNPKTYKAPIGTWGATLTKTSQVN